MADVEDHNTWAESTVQYAVVTDTQSKNRVTLIVDARQLSRAWWLNAVQETPNPPLYVPAALSGLHGLQSAEGCSCVDEVGQPLPHYLFECFL